MMIIVSENKHSGLFLDSSLLTILYKKNFLLAHSQYYVYDILYFLEKRHNVIVYCWI